MALAPGDQAPERLFQHGALPGAAGAVEEERLGQFAALDRQRRQGIHRRLPARQVAMAGGQLGGQQVGQGGGPGGQRRAAQAGVQAGPAHGPGQPQAPQ